MKQRRELTYAMELQRREEVMKQLRDAKRARKNAIKSNNHSACALTKAELRLLSKLADGVEEWLDDMEAWLAESGHSDVNIRQTMRAVRELCTGEGRQHPKKSSVIFRKGDPIRIDESDMQSIMLEAIRLTKKHGDTSNGWLFTHPVNKLMLYQRNLVHPDRGAKVGKLFFPEE